MLTPKPQQIVQDGDWLGQRSGTQKSLLPLPPPFSQFLELKAELLAGLLWKGPPRAQGPDDGCLFAMCMFCIFSSFCSSGCRSSGGESPPAVCSTSPDSDG